MDLPSLGLEGQGGEWGVESAGLSRWAAVVGAALPLGQWLALHIKDQCGWASNHSQKASSFPQKPENKENLNNSGNLLYRNIFNSIKRVFKIYASVLN